MPTRLIRAHQLLTLEGPVMLLIKGARQVDNANQTRSRIPQALWKSRLKATKRKLPKSDNRFAI